MRKLEMYQCEFCGAVNSDVERIKDCEASHSVLVRIDKAKYYRLAKYPNVIDMLMDDGVVVTYKRADCE